MAIKKQVKESADRQRINLNKSDGFKAGDEVYILTADELNQYKETILDLNIKLDSADKEKETAIETAKEMNENIISDLNKTHANELSNISAIYEKEINNKEDKIKQLEHDLNTIKDIASNFLIKLNGLNIWDMVFRHKHNDLINDFQQTIWINSPDIEIVDKKDKTSLTEKDTDNNPD